MKKPADADAAGAGATERAGTTMPRELVEALGDLLGEALAADLKAHPEEPPQRPSAR